MTTLITINEADSNTYVPALFDLDYDEPNSVVEEFELEFVVASEFVQTVDLPVEAAAVEPAPAQKQTSVKETQRTAA